MDKQEKDFGTIGLKLGDKIYGPRDAVAIVYSEGGGTIVKVLKPYIQLPPSFPGEIEANMMNYSLSLATKRILGMPAYETLEQDVFEYWYFQGQPLSTY